MRRLVPFIALCLLGILLAGAPPAAAEPVDDDTGGDALSELTLESFTASPRSVPAGGSITLHWIISGNAPAAVRLDGRVVGKTGSSTVTPTARDETHTLTATAAGTTAVMGRLVVGVNPCASVPTPQPEPTDGGPLNPTQPAPDLENAPVTGQCAREGTARFTYERGPVRVPQRHQPVAANRRDPPRRMHHRPGPARPDRALRLDHHAVGIPGNAEATVDRPMRNRIRPLQHRQSAVHRPTAGSRRRRRRRRRTRTNHSGAGPRPLRRVAG